MDVHLWATAPAWPAHSLELPVSIAAEASAMVYEVSLVALGLGLGLVSSKSGCGNRVVRLVRLCA